MINAHAFGLFVCGVPLLASCKPLAIDPVASVSEGLGIESGAARWQNTFICPPSTTVLAACRLARWQNTHLSAEQHCAAYRLYHGALS